MINLAANPVAPAKTLDELQANVNQAFNLQNQVLLSILSAFTMAKRQVKRDSTSFGPLTINVSVVIPTNLSIGGTMSFGTYTGGIIAQAGSISITDANGTTRRLLVG